MLAVMCRMRGKVSGNGGSKEQEVVVMVEKVDS